jgi:hypothetical protein
LPSFTVQVISTASRVPSGFDRMHHEDVIVLVDAPPLAHRRLSPQLARRTPRFYPRRHERPPRCHHRRSPRGPLGADQERLADLIAAYVANHAGPVDLTEAERAELKRRHAEPFDPAPDAEVREFFDRHRG